MQQSANRAKFACPCCGYLTLAERGAFDICPVCYWEDDGEDDEDSDAFAGRELNLKTARENFRSFGACARRFRDKVRAPLPEEVPAI